MKKTKFSYEIFFRETLLPQSTFAKFVIFSKFNVQRPPCATSVSTFSSLILLRFPGIHI